MQGPVFEISLKDAIFTLEANGLLAREIPVNSPLREVPKAGNETNKGNLASNKIPVFWNSADIQSFAAKFSPQTSEAANSQPKFIFVASKGLKFDANTLICQILQLGGLFVATKRDLGPALARISQSVQTQNALLNHPLCVLVNCDKSALYNLLIKSCQIDEESFFSVMVTGTNGKTSVVQILGDALSHITKTPTAKIGTLGVQIAHEVLKISTPTMPTIPEFVCVLQQMQARGLGNLVMEATSQGLHQKRLGNFKSDIVVFTNLTQDHLDYHKTMESYLQAKLILFKQHIKKNGCAVVNCEDPSWKDFAQAATENAKSLFGYGMHRAKDAWFKNTTAPSITKYFLEFIPEKITLNVQGQWQLFKIFPHNHKVELIDECRYFVTLVGDFQHANLAAAASTLVAKSFSLQSISQALSKGCNIPGRMQLVLPNAASIWQTDPTPKSPTNNSYQFPSVLVDYAHSPDALQKALEVCKKNCTNGAKVWCVFGCGGDRDPQKRPIMGQIAAQLADFVIITSDNPRSEKPLDIMQQIEAGVTLANKTNQVQIKMVEDREEAIVYAIHSANSTDIVLIAGKGHEDYQIIGDKKCYFSDVEVAREAINRKAQL